jgi:uncharacterized protein (DUF2147 family)
MKTVLSLLALVAASSLAQAQSTPVGLWRTIDDETKAEKSTVRISETGGVLSGKVEKVFDATKQDVKCDKCSDERKDQLVLGMTIIRNVKHNADDKAVWDGGDILDPNNGKVYKLRLKPMDGGKALEVRGYIGPFYRNQQWVRVE